MNPTFVPDVAGLYAPRAVAFDGLDEGEPHGVYIWAGTNEPPIAVAPDDATIDVARRSRSTAARATIRIRTTICSSIAGPWSSDLLQARLR